MEKGFHVNNVERYAVVSSLEYPSVVMVSTRRYGQQVMTHTDHSCLQTKTTRQDTGVTLGTGFSYHKVPGCLIPYGWTNDPVELEASLGLNLHNHYPSFPQQFSPVLSYMGVVPRTACLVSDGSPLDPDFHLITSDYQVFRLDTAIELLPLIVWMREEIRTLTEKKGAMYVGLESLLEHPELEWHRLDQDE